MLACKFGTRARRWPLSSSRTEKTNCCWCAKPCDSQSWKIVSPAGHINYSITSNFVWSPPCIPTKYIHLNTEGGGTMPTGLWRDMHLTKMFAINIIFSNEFQFHFSECVNKKLPHLRKWKSPNNAKVWAVNISSGFGAGGMLGYFCFENDVGNVLSQMENVTEPCYSLSERFRNEQYLEAGTICLTSRQTVALLH